MLAGRIDGFRDFVDARGPYGPVIVCLWAGYAAVSLDGLVATTTSWEWLSPMKGEEADGIYKHVRALREPHQNALGMTWCLGTKTWNRYLV